MCLPRCTQNGVGGSACVLGLGSFEALGFITIGFITSGFRALGFGVHGVLDINGEMQMDTDW